jgi:type IV secretion system protein VirB6
MTTFVTTIGGTINQFLTNDVNGMSANVSAIIAPIALGGMTLYTMVYGFAILRGDVQAPISQFLWKNLKTLFILGVALGIGVTQNQIIQTFFHFQAWLASALAGVSGDTFTTLLENFLARVLNTCGALLSNVMHGITQANAGGGGGWFAFLSPARTIGNALIGIFAIAIALYVCFVYILFAFLLAGCALLVFLAAEISLAAVLAVGPLFIASLAFDKTARYFDSWLSQGLNYCFVAGFVGMVLGLAISVLGLLNDAFMAFTQLLTVDNFFSNIATIFEDLISFVVACLMFIWFFFQCPSVASGLVGGSGLSHPVQSAARLAERFMGMRAARQLEKIGGQMSGSKG